MVYLTYLSGPHKGRKRNVTKVDPEIIFRQLFEFGWDWEINYYQATEEELRNWASLDMGCRISRALQSGRSVSYLGKTYVVTDLSKFEEVVRNAVAYINKSGFEIGIDRDDENGVVLVALQCLN